MVDCEDNEGSLSTEYLTDLIRESRDMSISQQIELTKCLVMRDILNELHCIRLRMEAKG